MKKIKIILCSLAFIFGLAAFSPVNDNNAQVASANDSLFNHNFMLFFSEGATGTHGIEENYYNINIENSTGTDWHVKFEKRIYVDRPYQYIAKWTFETSKAGDVVVNGQNYQVTVGNNVIERVFHSNEAGEDNSINIELQLGKLPSNTNVKVYKLELFSKEDLSGNINLLENYSFVNNNAGWGYDYIEATDEHLIVKSHIGESNDAWRDQLIIKTNLTLEPGQYNIWATVKSDHDKTIEFCAGLDGDDAAFKKLYEQYGVFIKANEETTIGGDCHYISETLNGVCLRLSLGNHSTSEQDTFTVTNIRIQKWVENYSDVKEKSVLEFASISYAFIRDWRKMRTDGGENGICAALDSEVMTKLLERYDALSSEDRALVDAAADGDTTIANSIEYVKAYRATQPSYSVKNVLLNGKEDSVSLILIIGLIGISFIAAYYLINKKSIAK